MDIQAYISSGIIEAYVLGMASGEEVRELEALSAQYPELVFAIEECRSTMDDYASLHTIAPPPELKEKIWSAIAADSNLQAETLSAELPPIPATPASAEQSSNVVSFDNNNSRKKMFASGWAAAAVILLVASLGFNFMFWNKSSNSEKEMAAVKAQQQTILASNEAMQNQLNNAQKELQMFQNPEMKPVMLAGVGTHTDNQAMVMWDTKSKDVYLSLKNMPPPPSGKQYQLWAIVDGKPVDLGVYASDESGMQKMKIPVNGAQMFAITLEKEGGSPTPTMDQMYVAGKV